MAIQTYRVLGLDPGTTNHAWAAIEIRLNPFRTHVVASGMVTNTVTELTGDPHVMANKYKREIRALIKKYNLKYIVAERFMSRGLRGKTGEMVSVMLGLLLNVGIKDVRFVTAAQWKNQWNVFHDLKAFYKAAAVVPHQIDACNIGIYAGNLWFGTKNPFEFLGRPNGAKKFQAIIQKTNLGEVLNRRSDKNGRKRVGKTETKVKAGNRTSVRLSTK